MDMDEEKIIETIRSGKTKMRSRAYFFMQAALAALDDDGGGVLLGHAALLGRHLHEGSLVAPMGRVTDTGRHLAILLPEQPAGVVSAVAAWLDQAATA